GIPGVELSTGSLGHGLSVGAGMALSGKMNQLEYRVFVVLGDGECDEGSVWEAALFAPHRRLDNLVAIIDYNKLQGLDTTHEALELEPFAAKWRNFGWDVAEVDGHDHEALEGALQQRSDRGKPRCVIAHTVKGKGVSFMENQVVWHYRWPRDNEVVLATEELMRSDVCATP
ncbi:MAG TPA: thiamine pyrophosphate-dependent enzyme, partial [Nitrospira sp.]|nr:thiamine pyrophosphate-dependent enzyme [Nitrospira sp.]